jgi:hypothetical protein
MDVPYVRCGACGRGLGPDGLNPTFLGRTFADMSPGILMDGLHSYFNHAKLWEGRIMLGNRRFGCILQAYPPPPLRLAVV